jgi:hypothetical protein
MNDQAHRGELPGGILSPAGADEAGGNAFEHGFRAALRAVLQEQSIRHYLHVFGAVPERPPYRQWLNLDRDNYVHIADVWANPDFRARVLTRLDRRPRASKLRRYLLRDLKYLDEFAGHRRALLGLQFLAPVAVLDRTPEGEVELICGGGHAQVRPTHFGHSRTNPHKCEAAHTRSW